MALSLISIHNFVAIKEAAIQLQKRINIFTGKNRSGKTSIACSLEYLFTGQTRGLELKKDAPALIHDGAKQAEIVATYNDGVTIRRARTASGETLRFIPASSAVSESKVLPPPYSEWPALALNPATYFDQMDAKARKAALAAVLLKGKAEPKDILSRLTGIDESMAATFAATAANECFEAAREEVIQKRREAKRKLDDLDVSTLSTDVILAGRHFDLTKIDADTVREQLKEREGERDKVMQAKGAAETPKESGPLKADIEAALANAKAELNQLMQPQHSIAELDIQIAKAEAEIVQWRKKIREAEAAITVSDSERKTKLPKLDFTECPVMPQINCPVKPADRAKVLKAFDQSKKIAEKIIDDNKDDIEKANAEIYEAEKIIREKRIEITDVHTYEKRLGEARSSILALENALPNAATGSEPEILTTSRDFEAEIAALDESLAIGRNLLRHIEAYKISTERAANSITESATLNKQIELYNRLDKEFSPDGIPMQLMADALRVFQQRLIAHGALFNTPCALDSGDGLPIYNRRPYGLCCESEKWQARVIFQEALAFFSNVPYLIIDGADIQDADYKGAFAGFLMKIAPQYERVFVFATESDIPPSHSDHPDLQFWKLADGTVKAI